MNAAVHELGAHAEAPDDDRDDESVHHTWNADTRSAVEAYGQTVAEVAAEREALSARLQAAKTDLVAKGFNRDALKAAISYANTAEKDRLNWDQSYIYARRALGCPIQEDMFVAAMQDEVVVEAPAE